MAKTSLSLSKESCHLSRQPHSCGSFQVVQVPQSCSAPHPSHFDKVREFNVCVVGAPNSELELAGEGIMATFNSSNSVDLYGADPRGTGTRCV